MTTPTEIRVDAERPEENIRAGSGETRPGAVLARLRAEQPGVSLVVLGALHGNETCGARALERVLPILSQHGLERGDLVALIGNPSALNLCQRYVDRDLNRSWDEQRIERLRAGSEEVASREDTEMLNLARDFEAVASAARGPCYILDLHSTSGDSIPFLNVGDTLPSRWFARSIPVPVVLGLDEALSGTLLQYIEERGFIGVVFEAGQHNDVRSVDHAEAAIWIALQTLDLLPRALYPKAAWARGLLAEVSHGEHRMFDVVYRHHLDAGTVYEMGPGFASFQPVRAGDRLARENGKDVVAPRNGTLLMPLYQTQGDDGFFLMTVCSGLRQWTSRTLRRMRIDRLMSVLPGIERPSGKKRQLWVSDRWRSGWRELVLRLLGYRIELERQPNRTLVARRRQRPLLDPPRSSA